MTREEAVEIARKFIATSPEGWQRIWPAKNIAVKLRISRKSDQKIWEVRSLRQGLGIANISIEINPETGDVIYASIGGGRGWPEEHFNDGKAILM